MKSCDCLIVGGGVIGLSLAYELAREGLSVTVIDRGEPGREASWAGAGIFPPASSVNAIHAYEQLRARSFAAHRVWARRLRDETGIDNGYRECGGLYLGFSAGEAASLLAFEQTLLEEQIPVERLDTAAVAALEPELAAACTGGAMRLALRLPTETQIRNPRHMKALLAACQARGVEVRANCEAVDVTTVGDRMTSLTTTTETLTADRFCFCAGAWTRLLMDRLGIPTVIMPVRGQMLLYRCAAPPLTHIVNEGHRYLVPRLDGLLLAGSTEEEVGFAKQNTAEGIAGVRNWAEGILPALRSARLEQTWAGLRPGTEDGFPYLGPLPRWRNAFIAAGHYRSGLYLSTGTAEEMSKLIRGQPTEIDLAPFSLLR